jgi:hypothetical protein
MMRAEIDDRRHAAAPNSTSIAARSRAGIVDGADREAASALQPDRVADRTTDPSQDRRTRSPHRAQSARAVPPRQSKSCALGLFRALTI